MKYKLDLGREGPDVIDWRHCKFVQERFNEFMIKHNAKHKKELDFLESKVKELSKFETNRVKKLRKQFSDERKEFVEKVLEDIKKKKPLVNMAVRELAGQSRLDFLLNLLETLEEEIKKHAEGK